MVLAKDSYEVAQLKALIPHMDVETLAEMEAAFYNRKTELMRSQYDADQQAREERLLEERIKEEEEQKAKATKFHESIAKLRADPRFRQLRDLLKAKCEEYPEGKEQHVSTQLTVVLEFSDDIEPLGDYGDIVDEFTTGNDPEDSSTLYTFSDRVKVKVLSGAFPDGQQVSSHLIRSLAEAIDDSRIDDLFDELFAKEVADCTDLREKLKAMYKEWQSLCELYKLETDLNLRRVMDPNDALSDFEPA